MSILSRSLAYGGVSLPVAAAGAAMNGSLPIGAAGAIALLSVLLIGARLRLAGLDVGSLGPRTRRVAAAGLGVLIVSSVVLCGVSMGGHSTGVGTADAAGAGAVATGYHCALNGWGALLGITQQCQTPDQVENASAADLYAQALALNDYKEQQRTTIQNNLQASRSAVWCQLRANVSQSVQQGLNRSQAKARANATVDAHYTVVEKNYITTTNTIVAEIEYMTQSASQDGSISKIRFNLPSSTGGAHSSDNWWGPGIDGVHNTTVTLANGSKTRLVQLQGYLRQGDHNNTITTGITSDLYSNGWVTVYGPSASTSTSYDGFNTADPHVRLLYLDGQWVSLWSDIKSEDTTMKTQASQYVDGIYNTYNKSQLDSLDANDLQSACSLATYSTDVNTTGSYAQSRAALSLAGLKGSVNSSMTISYQKRVNGTLRPAQTLSGGLYTNWVPNGTSGKWVKGHTYDTADTSKSVEFVAGTDQNGSHIVDLHGTFTVESITDVKTGDSLNSTTLNRDVPRTANSSRLLDEVNKILNWRKKWVNTHVPLSPPSPPSVPSGPSFNLGLGGIAVVVIAGGGALLLLGRN